MAFGTDSFGTSPFGTSDGSDGSLTFTAAAIDAYVVELTFSADLISNGIPSAAGSYMVRQGPRSLTVFGAWLYAANKVRITTAKQYAGLTHAVVLTSLNFIGIDDQRLVGNTATFVGSADVTRLLVSGLQASTSCVGRRIDLMWTNPVGTEWVYIARSENNPIIDLDDPHTVAYSGEEIETFSDTGLADDKYYYYTVMAASVPTPTPAQLTIAPQSRVECLSIAEKYLTQSLQFVEANTPNVVLELDDVPLDEGGGEGFAAKVNSIIACWIALHRGKFNAIPLLNDPTKAPFSVIPARLRSVGLSPEGMAYDLSVPRRMLRFWPYVMRSRGSATGLQLAIRMLAGWESDIKQVSPELFDVGRNAVALATHNNKTKRYRRTGGTVVQTTTTMTDTGLSALLASTAADAWKGGAVMSDVTGDLAEIDSNSTSGITFKTPEVVATLTATANAAATSLTIAPGNRRIKPGMAIQIMNGSAFQIVRATAVNPGGIVTVYPPVQAGGFAVGSTLSIQLSAVRKELVSQGTVAEVSSGNYRVTLTSLLAQAAYQFTASGQHQIWVNGFTAPATITSCTSTTIFFSATAGQTGGTQQFAICKGTYGGASYAARVPTFRYTIYSGKFATVYNPSTNRALYGSKYDQANRTLHGRNARGNAWGDGDVLVHMDINTPHHVGQSRAVPIDTDGTFILDPSVVAPLNNTLVGYFLNPNQSQTELIRIVGNTTSRLFLETGAESLVNPGSYYFILTPRMAAKYSQLVTRVPQEFSHSDVALRFLFA